MVVPEDVEGAVDREADQLLLQAGHVTRLPSPVGHESRGRGGTYVYVSEQGSIGLGEGERDDVGEAPPAADAGVQATHRRPVQQRQLDARVAGPLPGPHPPRRAGEPRLRGWASPGAAAPAFGCRPLISG